MWNKFLVWIGHRCLCGGTFKDTWPKYGWAKDQCNRCGRVRPA